MRQINFEKIINAAMCGMALAAATPEDGPEVDALAESFEGAMAKVDSRDAGLVVLAMNLMKGSKGFITARHEDIEGYRSVAARLGASVDSESTFSPGVTTIIFTPAARQ